MRAFNFQNCCAKRLAHSSIAHFSQIFLQTVITTNYRSSIPATMEQLIPVIQKSRCTSFNCELFSLADRQPTARCLYCDGRAAAAAATARCCGQPERWQKLCAGKHCWCACFSTRCVASHACSCQAAIFCHVATTSSLGDRSFSNW